jgi:raffinose/stachyose/melibiose transport system substrate-binding protein
VFDTIFQPKFYSDMNSVWQGEWNLPLKDLSGVKIADSVTPLYGEVMKNLATAVGNNQYGYTTWTFLPPETDTYLVSGLEEVWLGKIKSTDYLKKWDDTFKQEKDQGKVPAIPPRAS